MPLLEKVEVTRDSEMVSLISYGYREDRTWQLNTIDDPDRIDYQKLPSSVSYAHIWSSQDSPLELALYKIVRVPQAEIDILALSRQSDTEHLLFESHPSEADQNGGNGSGHTVVVGTWNGEIPAAEFLDIVEQFHVEQSYNYRNPTRLMSIELGSKPNGNRLHERYHGFAPISYAEIQQETEIGKANKLNEMKRLVIGTDTVAFSWYPKSVSARVKPLGFYDRLELEEGLEQFFSETNPTIPVVVFSRGLARAMYDKRQFSSITERFI